jgi:hypothetical protein
MQGASPDDCPAIRTKLQEMKDKGAPEDLTSQLETQINLICD